MASTEENGSTSASRSPIEQLKTVRQVIGLLARYSRLEDKIAALATLDVVKKFVESEFDLLSDLTLEEKYLIYVLLALNQGEELFFSWQTVPEASSALKRMLQHFHAAERFYDYMGGVLGYFEKTIELMIQQYEQELIHFDVPEAISIQHENKTVSCAIVDGISAVEQMAEIYVLGGAGERLGLQDDKTFMPLPVACLQFLGRSLLEGLIRDLQAREYLSYKLTKRQVTVPVILMTSMEKDNDLHIKRILEEAHYFGRPESSIICLKQPLAPVLTSEGHLAITRPLEVVVKPGGHGVVWKLACDEEAFTTLKKLGKKYCLVRQINNPIAGVDYGLLALLGYGSREQKAFGFLSCPSIKGMAEGMNVLRKTGSHSNISNIEYTEFAKLQVKDTTQFPANTNILFVAIDKVIEAAKKMPVPGLLVNLKTKVKTAKGEMVACRLESSMQNIADAMPDQSTFLLVNDRKKTMSVTKKSYDGTSIQETPEGAFYDLLQLNIALLKERCHFTVPPSRTKEAYIQHGPEAIFLYHPALGPVYDIIMQKIKGGKLAQGAELQIEAEEVMIRALSINGSLLINAKNCIGSIDKKSGLLHFSNKIGHVTLENVQIVNKGIDHEASNCYWKNEITRKEACQIILEGYSSFIAKNVTISGDQRFVVQDGEELIVEQDDQGKLIMKRRAITTCSAWSYTIDSKNKVLLSRACP